MRIILRRTERAASSFFFVLLLLLPNECIDSDEKEAKLSTSCNIDAAAMRILPAALLWPKSLNKTLTQIKWMRKTSQATQNQPKELVVHLAVVQLLALLPRPRRHH